jgi:hypothetical protein
MIGISSFSAVGLMTGMGIDSCSSTRRDTVQERHSAGETQHRAHQRGTANCC